jgi:hypothetical protein
MVADRAPRIAQSEPKAGIIGLPSLFTRPTVMNYPVISASVPTDEDLSWFWVPAIAAIAFFVGAYLLWIVFKRMMREDPPQD